MSGLFGRGLPGLAKQLEQESCLSSVVSFAVHSNSDLKAVGRVFSPAPTTRFPFLLSVARWACVRLGAAFPAVARRHY